MHGECDISVFKIHIDLLWNQVVKTLNGFSLDVRVFFVILKRHKHQKALTFIFTARSIQCFPYIDLFVAARRYQNRPPRIDFSKVSNINQIEMSFQLLLEA